MDVPFPKRPSLETSSLSDSHVKGGVDYPGVAVLRDRSPLLHSRLGPRLPPRVFPEILDQYDEGLLLLLGQAFRLGQKRQQR